MTSKSGTDVTSSATQDTEKYSTSFPPGCGDFALKSSNGVIFHFSRFLLSHVSPVFKEMYEMGMGTTKDVVLSLTEDSTTLETLLSFIDPTKKNPPLEWKSVENFLIAADKYQIVGATDWFDREVREELLQRRKREYGLQDPMTCLRLATYFSLPELSRFALRDLIKYSIEDINYHQAVDGRLMYHLFKLRTQRARELARAANTINNHVEDLMRKSDCDMHRGDNQFDWARKNIWRIIVQPSWRVLIQSFEDEVEYMEEEYCTCLEFDVPEGLDSKIRSLESSLPDLPGTTH
jgi:hypothetical protein